ncbi:MAG: hypothetical protein GEV10_06030 [Streptosporangiales bacterium]|nr:hypothetical protein [Streptosporangiales bacterium]
MLDAALDGLLALLTPQSLLFMAIGVAFGIVIGFLPGVGGVVAMALLLPFIFGRDPAAAMALLLGAHVATIYNDAITGILFGVPGSAKGVALCFDGYPMTQRGGAARALGITAMSSLLGGLVGVAFLIAILPVVRALMLALGPPEYFIMGLWGLSVIALFSKGSVFKGLAAGGLGLLLATVGEDPVSSTQRFTFGSLYLADGVDFAVAAIGLFAVSQMISLYVKGGTIVTRRPSSDQRSTVWHGVRDVFRHKRVLVQSSALGVFIGALPGVGAAVGGIAAYGQVARSSRDSSQFGKGDVRGIVAPAATLGANEGGGLLPTLGFGIPGGESGAILLSALLVIGVAPGPELLTSGLDLVFSMIWVIVLANLLTTGAGLFTAPIFARMTTVPGSRLVPLILAVCFTGVYAINQRVEDVVLCALLGVVGYFLKKYRYPLAGVAIGLVLGPILERYLHVSVSLYGSLFWLERPVSLLLLIFVIGTVVASPARAAWATWRRRRTGGGDGSDVDAESVRGAPR